MEKKTIWQTPDKIPTAYESIVFCTPFCSALCGYYEPASDDLVDAVTNTYYHRKVVSKWAYASDLVAASKALDVAIEVPTNIEEYNCDVGDVEDAARALLKISEIMKGGK